jgi:hypothetical protein
MKAMGDAQIIYEIARISYLVRFITMLKTLLFAAVGLILVITSCSKSAPSSPPPSFTTGYNIYMAGTADGKAVYWKNGVEVDLAPSGTASSITVSGTDVYVGGYINDGLNIEAAYWKNGQQIQLEGPGVSHVFGIALNGTDIYCVGDLYGPQGNGQDSVTYWVNGTRMHYSPNTNGQATSIMFAGSEMYVGGQVWDLSGNDTAVVWKNGVQNWYGTPGGIYALGLSPTDTFAVGNLGTLPTYWTHTNFLQLASSGYGTSIAISGSDIYIGGDTLNIGGTNQAVYWKNNIMIPLKSQYGFSSVLGMAVAGTDIYAVGEVNDNIKYIPVFWKNGTIYNLGDNGTAYAICTDQ